MRPTTFIGIVGLVIIGVMLADVLANPTGTQAASKGMVSIIDPTYNALLGKTS